MSHTTGPEIKPLRMRMVDAQVALGISYSTLHGLVSRDLFTVHYPNGRRGKGCRVFLLTEEVEIYAKEGEIALRNFRDKQQKATVAKRAKR